MAGFRVSIPYVLGGIYNVTPPVGTDGQTIALQVDGNGNLKVNVVAGGGSGSNAAAGPTGSPVPADASYTGVNIGGTLFGVTGFNLPDSIPMSVAIVDANGDQITSFGGGTQYADDAASGATPTGTLSMGWDSANSVVRALKVDSNQNLLVDTVTASAAQTPLLVPVSTSSTLALASNSLRKGCTITNLSFSTISLAFGATAATLFNGLTLGPGGTFWMDSQDFTTAGINAIASDTEGNLAIQEFN